MYIVMDVFYLMELLRVFSPALSYLVIDYLYRLRDGRDNLFVVNPLHSNSFDT